MLEDDPPHWNTMRLDAYISSDYYMCLLFLQNAIMGTLANLLQKSMNDASKAATSSGSTLTSMGAQQYLQNVASKPN